MIELNKDKMANAVKRCRQLRPLVAALSVERREYLVESTDRMTMHAVRLSVEGGKRFADCPCKAGRSGLMCYHAVAAVTLHLGLSRQRAALPTTARPSQPRYEQHAGPGSAPGTWQ